MKRISAVELFVPIIAFIVSGQLLTAEQFELKVSAKLSEPITNILLEGSENLLVKKLTSTKNENERKYLIFVTGGLSNFREDLRTTVGDGASPRFALGVQYNNWFGLELFAETAPALSPTSLLEDLEKQLNQTATSFAVNTTTNRYLGLLSKFSYDVKKGLALVGRVGFAKFEAHETSARLQWKNEADQSLFTYHKLDEAVKGYSPVVSFGYEAPFPYKDRKKASMEMFLTQMFDDKVKNLSLSTTFKYSF